jgi:dipeptidyl aminopeptidase/acylaminoacyl peptidase
LGVANTISYHINAKGEWVILSANKDLKLLNMITGKERQFASIKSHKWFGDGNQLLLVTAEGELKILNLATGKEHSFSGVKDYTLNPDEKSILFVTKKSERSNELCLQSISLEGERSVTIWTGNAGEKPGNYVFDKAGEQLAFSSQSQVGVVCIWYYKAGQPVATMKIDDKTVGLGRSLHISGLRAFSGNGRWLFFNMRKQFKLLSKEAVTTPVDIWSYQDETLYPAQSGNKAAFRDYATVLEVSSNRAQLLEQEDDEKITILAEDHVILQKGGTADRIGPWWPYSEPLSIWLLSLKNGKRKLIIQTRDLDFTSSISPHGRWMYYWDPDQNNYFNVSNFTGQSINLTEKIPFSLIDDIHQLVDTRPVGIAGWYTGDSAMLIYDNYDIWKLDPAGKKRPVNITGGYGRKHKIKLRLVYGNKNDYHGNEEILLTGFDVETKYNGFFSIKLDKPGDPELLTMGPYTYCQTTVYKQSFSGGMPPLQGGSGKNKRWVVMRESAMDYPNYFVSKDLKQFTPLTNLQAHKAYNWLHTEVICWTMYDGKLNYGVLYKPDNFDSTKKYPVIFNYYEKYSQRCYQFPVPGLTTDNINIPWFVSRGYLVFTPDIQYTVASQPGGMTISEAACNAVASAAEYLTQRPYIKKSCLAIQGHSFGGHETNAIITQTNLFAAAAQVAGYSDHVSAYLTLTGFPVEKEHKIDHFNQRMGATPWERPDLFRRNSPVLNVDKVATPLLIVHNKNDGSVNFRQGLEMYMAMRRLGKPSWLLQYDNSTHVLRDKKDAQDYTIRLTQYFDHYLKEAPAPLWMTMNTLASYKDKNNLYELDSTGNCGNNCRVCRKWNARSNAE